MSLNYSPEKKKNKKPEIPSTQSFTLKLELLSRELQQFPQHFPPIFFAEINPQMAWNVFLFFFFLHLFES